MKDAAWYHTIRFPGGLNSAGVYDHQPHVDKYRLPQSLGGKEVLDVGCADGFFSFELERRGAQRVLALDTNAFDGSVAISTSPSKKSVYEAKYEASRTKNVAFEGLARQLGLPHVHIFQMAKKLMGSSVEYENRSIYNLDGLHRTFDLVFCGDLIEHLKNPVEAVEQLCAATKELCIIALSSVEAPPRWLPPVGFGLRLRERLVTYWGDGGGSFFHFSPEAFKKLILASGFSRVEIVSNFDMRNFRTNGDIPHVIFHCWK